MFNRSAHTSSTPAHSALEGFMPLESRRMLDAAAIEPADIDLNQITRLDGAPADVIIERDTAAAFSIDQPANDHDIYNFGQDRGPEIDDEAEYEPIDDQPLDPSLPPITDLSSAPAHTDIIIDAEPIADVDPSPAAPAAIALIPIAPKLLWISADSPAAPSLPVESGIVAPASWTDLAELPSLDLIIGA